MKRALTILAAGAALVLGAGTAVAAPPQPQTLTCEGGIGDIQILVGPAIGAETSFGAARVVGGGHLIPVGFRFTAFDVTVGETIFDSGPVTKGMGHANHHQPTVVCSSSETGMLGDFLDAGETPPPGTSVTDVVTVTLSATVVVK